MGYPEWCIRLKCSNCLRNWSVCQFCAPANVQPTHLTSNMQIDRHASDFHANFAEDDTLPQRKQNSDRISSSDDEKSTIEDNIIEKNNLETSDSEDNDLKISGGKRDNFVLSSKALEQVFGKNEKQLAYI